MPMNQEIDLILEDVLDVEGVTGAIVTDAGGKILAARMPSIYDYDTLGKMSKRLIKTLTNIRIQGIRFEEMVYYFSDVRLIVRNLRRGFLVIMSLPIISVPLLHVATNAARKRITGILCFPGKEQKKTIENVVSPNGQTISTNSTRKQ